MPKNILCCLMTLLGLTCANIVTANENGLNNTGYLVAHDVKKVAIGRSFANCKETSVSERYVSLKTCTSANVSDVYYMATGYFHHTATQLLSPKAMRLIERAGIKLNVAYKENRTSFGVNAHF